MNVISQPESSDAWAINRREAIKRTALILGAALSPSILAGVGRAQAAAAAAPAKPVHLSAAQFATAGAVAERIIPRTDTPGARDVGVPAFIDLMVGQYLTATEKSTFLAGLAEVESAGVAAHRREFTRLSTAEQDAILKRIAVASQAKTNTFFHLARELTLVGYFSSEPVGRNITHYNPIPGPFRGCVPIAEVGNVAWTR